MPEPSTTVLAAVSFFALLLQTVQSVVTAVDSVQDVRHGLGSGFMSLRVLEMILSDLKVLIKEDRPGDPFLLEDNSALKGALTIFEKDCVEFRKNLEVREGAPKPSKTNDHELQDLPSQNGDQGQTSQPSKEHGLVGRYKSFKYGWLKTGAMKTFKDKIEATKSLVELALAVRAAKVDIAQSRAVAATSTMLSATREEVQEVCKKIETEMATIATRLDKLNLNGPTVSASTTATEEQRQLLDPKPILEAVNAAMQQYLTSLNNEVRGINQTMHNNKSSDNSEMYLGVINVKGTDLRITQDIRDNQASDESFMFLGVANDVDFSRKR